MIDLAIKRTDEIALHDELRKVAQLLFASGVPAAPIVVRGAFTPQYLLPDSSVLNAWRVALATTSGSTPSRLRVYSDGRYIARPHIEPPAEVEQTLVGYCDSLHNETGTRWGFALSDPQVSEASLFRALLLFLSEVAATTQLWHFAVNSDLFLTTSPWGMFPVHKDAFDVITFVGMGHREYLLWPFEYFVARGHAGEGARYQLYNLENVNEEEHRSAAIVVQAEAGDVVFWPAEWWHRGLASTDPALTLALTIAKDTNATRALALAVDVLIKTGVRPAYPALECNDLANVWRAYRAALDRLLSFSAVRAEVERLLLRELSAMGLRRLPDPAAAPDHLLPTDVVCVVSPAALALLERQDSHSDLLFAAGREIDLPRCPENQAVIELLRSSRMQRISQLIDAATAAVGDDEVRHNESIQRVTALLELLIQCHALVKVS